mmetsp:Transcript_6155/g.15611  ORF Transcript_6155/g.15611 Transcript_6155/m.15611 type:complete len:260 (+) Transcript_6155:1073-1852(+)
MHTHAHTSTFALMHAHTVPHPRTHTRMYTCKASTSRSAHTHRDQRATGFCVLAQAIRHVRFGVKECILMYTAAETNKSYKKWAQRMLGTGRCFLGLGAVNTGNVQGTSMDGQRKAGAGRLVGVGARCASILASKHKGTAAGDVQQHAPLPTAESEVLGEMINGGVDASVSTKHRLVSVKDDLVLARRVHAHTVVGEAVVVVEVEDPQKATPFKRDDLVPLVLARHIARIVLHEMVLLFQGNHRTVKRMQVLVLEQRVPH